MLTNFKPLSIDPTQYWEGNDGPWSTFFLGIGEPLQYVRVLISLTVSQPWVVIPEGCTAFDPSTCPSHRGEIFKRNSSMTWKNEGLFTLGYERNLGMYENGLFGLDTLSTGLPGTAAVSLEKQIIAGIATKSFYLGLWGLGPRATNLSSFDNPYPSLMTNLKKHNSVPSISYGYTAGARYQLKQVLGSLTLGGFDASRFVSHNTTFNFAEDNTRDLVVGVQDISVISLNSSLSHSSTSLLPQPILSFIDAGESHIWLPSAACEAFAAAFGLTYDASLGLYLVDDTTHETLLQQNITITFQITSDVSNTSSNVVSIDFPYAAFDLELTADYPGVNTTTRYFPIRRAANDTQYTLGRTFLQQAYLVADYERANFSVYPCVFSEGLEQDLQSIPPLPDAPTMSNNSSPSMSPPESGHSFLPGVIAAIAIGSIVAVFLISSCAYILGRRRDSLEWAWRRFRSKPPHKSRKPKLSTTTQADPPDGVGEMEADVHHRGELNGDLQHPSELIAGLQRPGELSADTSRVGMAELEHSSATLRSELPQPQQDEVKHELEAGSVFPYVQTPMSKERIESEAPHTG